MSQGIPALPCAFWRATYCCFPEPMERDCLILLQHFRNKRTCEHKASPLLRCSGPRLTLRRGWWSSTPRYSRGWMTAISAKAYGSTPINIYIWIYIYLNLYFVCSQQASVSDERLRMALTLHCFGLTCTVCIAMQASPLPFTHNWSYCRALRTTWMFLLVLFVFHGYIHTHTHTHTVLIPTDTYRLTVTKLIDSR